MSQTTGETGSQPTPRTPGRRGTEDAPRSTYAVLLAGDEARWAGATDDERAATYARHEQFMKLLHDRGHELVGGAELTHSRQTRQVRGELDDVTVTDGPFAETTEQLTGFYLIRTADLDDLLNVCGLLAGNEADGAPVEVRALVPGQDEEATS
jgi:hypothetical protein